MGDIAVFAAVAAAAGAVVGVVWTMTVLSRRGREAVDAARAEAIALKKAAERDAAAALRNAESEGRDQAIELREAAEKKLGNRLEQQTRRHERQVKRSERLDAELTEITTVLDQVKEREREAQSKRDRARNTEKQLDEVQAEYMASLERTAGVTGQELTSRMVDAWVSEVRANAAQRLRVIEQNKQDPEYGREARRVMGIAIGRYHAHFLTERLLSNVVVTPQVADLLARENGKLMELFSTVAGVKLEMHESGEKVRLDSGDGVAREVARRAIAKLIKSPQLPRSVEQNPEGWIKQIQHNLAREIVTLGRKAFKELEIPPAHPEIVELVGKLNYRTSYTQNQWKHAMEAAYLGGMMASELGLDVKLMRRATLMHDIGKSLTHEIEGSHAVIGADYARRLGEAEIVANAIGSHHADEPPNSIYAYLVAAADAMSGARPGARREQTEQHSTRLDDLERISAHFRGVERAFAVQGGREIRVYVREREVSDLRAVELSTEIATKVADELTFPGQIKVTVIRHFEAVEIAS